MKYTAAPVLMGGCSNIKKIIIFNIVNYGQESIRAIIANLFRL